MIAIRDGIKEKAKGAAGKTAGQTAIHNAVANLKEKYTKEELVALRDKNK